jgi:methionyl-tRNA synthetase
VARTSNLIEKNELELGLKDNSELGLSGLFRLKMEEYNFSESLKVLWDKIRESDEFLSQTTPWKMTDKVEIKKVLEVVAQNILNIALLLKPFLPETAEKIIEQFKNKNIKKGEILFQRL